MASPKREDEPSAAEITSALNSMINNIGVVFDRLKRADIKTPPERYLFPTDVKATKEGTNTVPVIDLSCLTSFSGRAGGEHDFMAKEKVVEEIGRAAVEWGCFQVVNHGIPIELMERMDSQTRQFFTLAVDVKEQGQAPSRLESGYDGKFQNSMARVPWMETLLFIRRPSADVEAFMKRIWPAGNAPFCVEHRAVVNDHSARFAVSYFTTTPLSLVLESPPQVLDVKNPSRFKLGTTSGEYLGAFSKSAEAVDCGVISNERLLDCFRTDIVKNGPLEIV